MGGGTVELFEAGVGTTIEVGQPTGAGNIAENGAPHSRDQIGGGLDVIMSVGGGGHADHDVRPTEEDVRNAGGKWQDEEVVRDRNWVSSRQPSDIPALNQVMIELSSEKIGSEKIRPAA